MTPPMTNDAPAQASVEAVATIVYDAMGYDRSGAVVDIDGIPHGSWKIACDAAIEILALSPPPTVVAEDEAVGEIVMFEGVGKEVSWRKGKMPPAGSRLYTRPSPSAVEGWQDISTAPKDGSMILLFNKHHGEQCVMGWTEGVMEDVFEHGFWSDVGSRNAAITMSVNPEYFQFWRPLPAPPVSCIASEKGGL